MDEEESSTPSDRLRPSNSQELDYAHRGEQLQQWPFYFYVAGVVRCNGRSYDSKTLVAPFDPKHPDRRGQLQRILLHEPWAIPHLIGSSFPPKDKDPARRALLLLLLFKPWGPTVLHDLLCPKSAALRSSDPTWQQAWSDFQDHLQHLLEPISDRPAPFTPRYWAHRSSIIVHYNSSIAFSIFFPFLHFQFGPQSSFPPSLRTLHEVS